MNSIKVSAILEEIGTLLELRGENPFKCRAYHNAARVISTLTTDINELVATGDLKTIKGIGQALNEKITELVQTGTMAYYEELKSSLPSGLVEMLRIQGLGPKRIKFLYDNLRIETIEQLKKAAEDHTLATLEGFGKKMEENILKGIAQLGTRTDKHLYHVARVAAERVCAVVAEVKGVKRCEIAGSLRRRKEIIGDIDLLASARLKDAPAIMEAFVSHPDVATVVARGETKSSVQLASGITCDLRVVEEGEFPFALAYFTGSKEHNVAMRSLARQFGWTLNEYGFSALGSEEARGAARRIVRCTTEIDIYKALTLAYIPPELRENMGEIDAAKTNAIPELVGEDDLQGAFHCHTTYSDGNSTLREMAEAAQALGWKYLGIADHSKRATYANGLTEERVKQQHTEIDTLNRTMKNFRIFKGTEVDIMPDGTLDWSDDVLAQFDYVVASIHSKFKMTEAEATRRVIRALKNKFVTMLGHPTGRLLLRREGYPVNMIEVINAAADYGKIIEINANPHRLDIDWRFCKYAKERGVRLCINPDAHSTDGLEHTSFGVGIARKGWLEKKDIVNCRSAKEIDKLFSIAR